MRLGMGLYKESFTDDNLSFVQQAGCTDLVIHLTDYFKGINPSISRGELDGWGNCEHSPLWTEEELNYYVETAKKYNLNIEAIENFNPFFYYDILLDGPKKKEQIEDLKTLIRRIGKAGIKCIGYNFSMAGVWGWGRGPYARGNANSVRFNANEFDINQAIPDGMVWNMRYRKINGNETIAPISIEEVWERVAYFLTELIPVAEESNVKLAAHPDDPPMPSLRQTSRLVNLPEKYYDLFNIIDSPSNTAEYCLGSIQEMAHGDIYSLTEDLVQKQKVGYIHFRNVKGKVPHYTEVFVDEGDIDMKRIIAILNKHSYQGILIPDHTPDLCCSAPWHAGMAFALGYIKALMQSADELTNHYYKKH